MYAKVFQYKFPSITEAKVAASFCSDNLGKQITKFKNKKYIAYILKKNLASINLVMKNNFMKKKLKSNYFIYQKN